MSLPDYDELYAEMVLTPAPDVAWYPWLELVGPKLSPMRDATQELPIIRIPPTVDGSVDRA